MEPSDDESNDSFFETTKALKKKSSKENMTKNVKKSSIFDEDDDFMADLGFNPKQPKETKKSGFLDDLLATAAPPVKQESKTLSRQSTETTDYSLPQTRPKTSSGRPPSAGRAPSEKSIATTINDPLDLFSTKSKKKEVSSAVPQEKPKPISGPADWLGLSTSTKEEEAPISVDVYEPPRASTPVKFTEVVSQPKPVIDSHPMVQLASSNMQMVNALHTAQQQESQLGIAEQLKSQEQTLMELNQRQQNLLQQQENQFNELVQKQVTRQMQLENNIKAQQERISAHIQLLMTQPATNYTPLFKEGVVGNNERVEEDLSEEEQITLTAQVKKLELEKLRLEDTLSNTTALHEKEIHFIEEAYK